ncbi:hypothetical protein Zmor_015256 [Zophobas morio]|uniref:Cytochrome P450 n=1 Tax=Zophobas morio TaxID=2755281 RepID=A0AA38IM47_9CUCU|nr:hypothetical protein Zmor_015256 [Zophobas morio]
MTTFVAIITAMCIVVLVLWLARQFNKNKKYYKNIPGPLPLPIVGNALEFGSTTKLLHTLHKYEKKYGEIYKIQIGPIRNFVIVSDYKFVEYILSSMKLLTKSQSYDFLRPWLGTGLLTSDGTKWKKHRKLLTWAFHFQILKESIGVFETCSTKLVEKLQTETGNTAVDVYHYVTLCTLDIICDKYFNAKSTMGVTINAQDDDQSEYVQSVKAMTRIIIERAFSPLQMYDFLYPLTRNYYTQRKALNILHDKSYTVIKQKLQKLQNKEASATQDDDCDIKNRKSFLDILLNARVDGRPLTQEEIREEVDTFMFEATSAISFTLFCLASHESIQEKVFNEQQKIFNCKHDSTTTYDDLQNMKYLELVIKESLRLYPSVPVYSRNLCDELKYDGTTFPRGVTLLIFAYGIHRNSKYFKNPEMFNPDRFADIDGKLPYAYIPFSAGPRNCIGQKFAMLEMKCTISKILRKFKLKPATPRHTLVLAAESVLKSANGVKISLDLRQ